MQITVGLCGAPGNRHLPLQVGRSVQYPAGPFRALLTATMWVKQAGAIPEGLSLGLLTRAPDPDGYGYTECTDEASRAPTVLTPWDTRTLANLSAACVAAPPGSEPVQFIGLFAGDRGLAFYGLLQGARHSSHAPQKVVFRPYELKIRKPSPAPSIARRP